MNDFYSSLGKGVWSASRIDDLICPRRYYYSRERNLRSKESSVFAYAGGVGHVGLDAWYSTGDSEAAILAADCEWADYEPPDELAWLNRSHLLIVLAAYFDRWREKDAFTVLESECEFTREYPSIIRESTTTKANDYAFKYGGRRDLKVKDHAGLTYVVDHKFTSGNMGPYWFNQFNISNQLRGYSDDDIDGVIVNGIYMGKDGITGYHQPETYIDKQGKEKKKKQRSVDAAFQRKEYIFKGVQRQEWETNVRQKIKEVEWRQENDCWPQETAGGICRSCDFSKVCAASPRLREGIIKTDYIVRGDGTER